MEKRGISPLIATVLLIGFVVTIAAIFWAWYQSTVEGQAEETAEKTTSQYTCATNVDIKISNPTCDNETISFNIENIGLAELKDFRIIVNGTSQETLKFSQLLAPSGKIKTYVQYNSSLVQNLTHATVLPMISSTTCEEKRVTFTLDCLYIPPEPEDKLNDTNCENADELIYFDSIGAPIEMSMWVYNGLDCGTPLDRQPIANATINITKTGRHYVKANVSRGHPPPAPPQSQSCEEFYLNISNEAGPITYDNKEDPLAYNTTIDNLGYFNFTEGNNTVYMHHAAMCPDPPQDPPCNVYPEAESVDINLLCIYYDQ